MIPKWLFKKCVQSIIDFNKVSNKLYEDTNGVVDLINCQEITDLECCLSDLVSYCVDDKHKYPEQTDLDYFIYDLDCGTSWTEDSITDTNGKPIRMTNIDELWDYLKSNNPFIEDYLTDDPNNKEFSEDEFKQFLNEMEQQLKK